MSNESLYGSDMTEDENPKKRTVRLNVRLNGDMMERLELVAADIGVPASTLGAVAIGEYVQKKFNEKQLIAGAGNNLKEFMESFGRMLIESDGVASLEGDCNRLEED